MWGNTNLVTPTEYVREGENGKAGTCCGWNWVHRVLAFPSPNPANGLAPYIRLAQGPLAKVVGQAKS